MKKYQQGDVVMFKVDSDYFNKNTKNSSDYHTSYCGKESSHAIIAFGEVTGHKHQINMEDMVKSAGVTLSMGYNGKPGVDVPEGFIVTGNAVTITHEEHKPVELPPGHYMVRIVREFDHIAKRSRYVAD